MRKGFTLIELLIVIAIVGILAAIAIPNIINAKKRAAERRQERAVAADPSYKVVDSKVQMRDGGSAGDGSAVIESGTKFLLVAEDGSVCEVGMSQWYAAKVGSRVSCPEWRVVERQE